MSGRRRTAAAVICCASALVVGCSSGGTVADPVVSSTPTPSTPSSTPPGPPVSVGTPLPGAPSEFVGTSGRRLAVFDSTTGRLTRYLTHPPRHSWDGAVAIIGRGRDSKVVFVREERVLQVPLTGRRSPSRLVPGMPELSWAAISPSGRTLAYAWRPRHADHDQVDVVSLPSKTLVARYVAPPDGANGPLNLGVADVNDRYVVVRSSSHVNFWLHRFDFRATPSAEVTAIPNLTDPRGCTPFLQLWLRTEDGGAVDGIASCHDEWVYVHAPAGASKLRVGRPLPEGVHSFGWSPDRTGRFLIGTARRSVFEVSGNHTFELSCGGKEPGAEDCPEGVIWR